ncbi:hypothetical protein TELCIR_22164 [Teladorsagia circumcincta]|uniref:EGF-like domain-containing protein n=1 Tax=Teladorsagia circumcincta TaxID=45464 RepID=A0A2G9TEQ7_TELCI|nr:hypothetical protein TELCIR_22164 [Teladorsagia circumcincta]
METLGSKFIAFYDLLMMNMFYNCTDACKDEETHCRNGGFLHPRNCSKCICPSGYGGRLCDERPPGCGEELTANETWQTLEDDLNEHTSEVSDYESEGKGDDEEYDEGDDNEEEISDAYEYEENEFRNAVRLEYRYV